MDTLPDEFRRYLTNITVVVEEYPTEEDALLTGVGRRDLLGIFRGVARQERSGFFDLPPPMPDEIILFKRNIERICSTKGELVEEIRMTLVHEVGHYFGLSEEDLEQYEK